MSAFDDVLKLVDAWRPHEFETELDYRNSLAKHLREELGEVRIETEYRHCGTTADIYVKQPGYPASSEVFVEIKRKFLRKAQLDRLVGQIECLEPTKSAIIVVLCGEAKPALAARLTERYGSAGSRARGEGFGHFSVVLKPHPSRQHDSARSLGASASTPTTQKEVRRLLELHRRTILEARITNNIYAELHRFRDTFLRYGLADKSDLYRRFFDRWLADPIVEMGWTPAGGWTRERICELHADLERLRT